MKDSYRDAEYAYQQGRKDREKELEDAFEYLFGNEYSWLEVTDKAEEMNRKQRTT